MNYFKNFLEEQNKKKEGEKESKDGQNKIKITKYFNEISEEFVKAFESGDKQKQEETFKPISDFIDNIVDKNNFRSYYLNERFSGFNEDLKSLLKMQMLRVLSDGFYDNNGDNERNFLSFAGGKSGRCPKYSIEKSNKNYYSMLIAKGIYSFQNLYQFFNKGSMTKNNSQTVDYFNSSDLIYKNIEDIWSLNEGEKNKQIYKIKLFEDLKNYINNLVFYETKNNFILKNRKNNNNYSSIIFCTKKELIEDIDFIIEGMKKKEKRPISKKTVLSLRKLRLKDKKIRSLIEEIKEII